MANLNNLLNSLRCSSSRCPWTLQNSAALTTSCSSYSKLPKKLDNSQIEKNEESRLLNFKEPLLPLVSIKYWNEAKAVRQSRRKNTFPRNVDNVIDILNGLVYIRKTLPGTLKGLVFWLEKRRERRQLIEQKFLPRRHAILRPDLAAAHFLVRRGGSVKFLGQTQWVGIKEKNLRLPNAFVPGLYVEAIDLEGTNLYFEGLKNICDLTYLKSMSFKNLEHVDDWWLDWISTEYSVNLKHLDLSGCKNVTYRGLSCFYRFENLQSLNVEGVPDTPEFKLACIMLQDIMPELDILGIDLSLPEEIKAVGIAESETDLNEKASQTS